MEMNLLQIFLFYYMMHNQRSKVNNIFLTQAQVYNIINIFN